MEKLANQIKKQSIKSTPKTHFFKLKHIFSIFLLSSAVCLCFYTQLLSNFTDYTDRHYIFLLSNVILFFLICNFQSTNFSYPKENQHQPVVIYETKHQPLLLSPTIEEQDGEIDKDNVEIVRNGNRVGVICIQNDVSIIQDQETEHRLVVVEEHETGVAEEAAETEELNNRCEQFIRQMRERMKFESLISQKNPSNENQFNN